MPVRQYLKENASVPVGDAPYGSREEKTLRDIDNNVYPTVKIGKQVWMAENLRVRHYRDGCPIPQLRDGTAWGYATSGAFCYYNNDARNLSEYGLLYNGYAVNDRHLLAPEGWHVATEDDWLALEKHMGLLDESLGRYGFRGDHQGGALKDTGFDHWCRPNHNASNSSGFKALPSGFRLGYGLFEGRGLMAIFWAATKQREKTVRYRYLHYANGGICRCHSTDLYLGLSVRCVKNS